MSLRDTTSSSPAKPSSRPSHCRPVTWWLPLLVADSRLVLEGFVYDAGTLEVAVRAPDATRFEGLREQFRLNPQLQVEIGSTSYEGNEVIGRLRIRRQS